MTFLLDMTVKVSAVMLVALAAAALLRNRSAALRHWVLTIAIVCAAVIPGLAAALPALRLPLPSIARLLGGGLVDAALATPLALVSTTQSVDDLPGTVQSDTAAVSVDPERLIVAVWLTGVTIGGAALIAGLWRLRRLASRSALIRSGVWSDVVNELCAAQSRHRPVRLLQSSHAAMLVTWGTVAPSILLPSGARSWPESRVRIVLCHELAHVKRRDWLVMIVAALVCCVYWFNPIVWIACRRLRHESERACDDIVMHTGISGADYATHLLAVARETVGRHTWSPATAIAHPSALETRIRAMLNTQINRAPLTTSVRLVTTAALALIILPIAAASGAAAPAAASGARDLPLAAGKVPEPLVVESSRPNANEAQDSASINGVFYDQLGGLLPGVRVVLTHLETNVIRQAVTNSSGAFTFDQLPAGAYNLEGLLPGFQETRRRYGLPDGDGINLSITMPLGTVEESMKVTGGAPPPDPAAEARNTLRRLVARTEAQAGRGAPPSRIASPCVGSVGGCVRPPKMLARATPAYPPSLEAGRIEGIVHVTGQIGANGLLTNLQAASQHQEMADAVLEALNQWEFEPTYLNGVPVEANITITVEFTMQ